MRNLIKNAIAIALINTFVQLNNIFLSIMSHEAMEDTLFDIFFIIFLQIRNKKIRGNTSINEKKKEESMIPQKKEKRTV